MKPSGICLCFPFAHISPFPVPLPSLLPCPPPAKRRSSDGAVDLLSSLSQHYHAIEGDVRQLALGTTAMLEACFGRTAECGGGAGAGRE